MDAETLSTAVTEWKKILGDDHVLTDESTRKQYTENAGGVIRSVIGILRPSSASEVQDIVRIAGRFSIPLYPVSGGKNWGLGSMLPVRDDAVIVDLGRMNSIREINVRHHYAVVEPGVTQRQLVERIREEKMPLILNVTGSAADTSLIGNAMERGVGYFASRADGLSGLEVVLGNGEIIRTGFGHFPGARTTHLCRHGIGPSLDGLFQESNFGIVTAAGFDLMPESEAHAVVIARIAAEEDLSRFIERWADLRRQGIIRSVVHVANRQRTEIVLAPLLAEQLYDHADWNDPEIKKRVDRVISDEGFGPWSAVGGILGTKGQVREAQKEIRRAFRGLAETIFLNDWKVSAAKRLGHLLNFIPFVKKKEAMLLAVEPLYGLARGTPSDAPMKSAFWPVGETQKSPDQNPDHSHSGMLFCVPVLPAEGNVARETVAEVERTYEKYGFTPYITLNLVDDRSVEAVINLAFDRNNAEQVSAAHRCNDELTESFIKQGLIPYRMGIQSMGMILDEQDPYWRTVRELKKALDPKGIVAPGRYNLS